MIVVKGCNELLIYNAAEDLYYYMKLEAPILFETSTCVYNYNPYLYCYMDSGDYLYYASFSISVGVNSSINASFSKIFLEKSHFPDQKLLTGYDTMRVKYANLEEDSYMLLFSESLVAFGQNTPGLMQVSEEDYQVGIGIDLLNSNKRC